MDKELFKERSYSSCIHDAFELLCSNFATIFKKTWIASLVFALLAAAPLIVSNNILQNPSSGIVIIALQTLCAFIIYVLAGGWFDATYISMLKESALRPTLKRCTRMRAMNLLVSIVAATIPIAVFIGTSSLLAAKKLATGHAMQISALAAIALLIILALLALPYAYSLVRYVFDDRVSIREALTKGWRRGMKFYGFLFAVTAITSIIIAIIMIVLTAPIATLSYAQAVNVRGMLLGDPDGMPASFTLLYYISWAIGIFVCNYAYIWQFITLYYAYGTMEYRIENKEQKKSTNTTDND